MRMARGAGGAIMCAALVATAACSSGAQPQVAARQRAAVAYAKALAARAPQVAGEMPLTTTPPEDLSGPGETIGVANLVVRARYWTAPGSPDNIYRSLKQADPLGLRLSGWGRPSSPAEDVAGRGFVHFHPTDPPSYIDSSELYVEIEAGAKGQSIIAAFGEASAHPLRSSTETIPIAGSKVTIVRTGAGQKGDVNTVRLDAVRSAAFVRALNDSPVRAPGACFGGIDGSYSYAITLVARGRTWKITYPGGTSNCGGFGVVLGTESLPDLEPTTAIRKLINDDYLRGKGFLAGDLGTVGGPSGDGLRGLDRGTVMALSNGHVVARTSVTDQQGGFELEVPPGRYTLTGRSHRYESGHGVCRGYRAVTVKPDGSAYVNVLCQER